MNKWSTEKGGRALDRDKAGGGCRPPPRGEPLCAPWTARARGCRKRGGPRACGEGSAGCAHRPSSCPAVRSEPGTSDAYSSTRRDKSDVTSRHLEQANDQARNSSPLRPQVRPGSPRRAAPRHLALPEHYLPRRRWQRRRPSVRGCLHR